MGAGRRFRLGDRFTSCMAWAKSKKFHNPPFQACRSSLSIKRIILSTISIFPSLPDLELSPLLFSLPCSLSPALTFPSSPSLQTLPLDCPLPPPQALFTHTLTIKVSIPEHPEISISQITLYGGGQCGTGRKGVKREGVE